MKALNDDLQMRSRLAAADLLGGERLKERTARKVTRPRNPRPCCIGSSWRRPNLGDVVPTPFSAAAPPAPSPSAWGAAGSASSATRPISSWRGSASPKCNPCRILEVMTSSPSARSRAFPSAGWWSAGCWRRARGAGELQRPLVGKVRADGADFRRSPRLDSPGGRRGAGRQLATVGNSGHPSDNTLVPIDYLRQQVSRNKPERRRRHKPRNKTPVWIA